MEDQIGKVQNKVATIGLIVGGVLIVAVVVVALVLSAMNKKKTTPPAAPATSSVAAPAVAAQMLTFDGGEILGYKISYPLNWEMQQPNESSVIMGKYTGDDYTSLAIQNVKTAAAGGSFATLDELMQNYQNQIKATDANATFSDINDFPSLKTKDGIDLPAKIYDVFYTKNGQKINDRTLFVEHPSGKIFYVFTFKSTQFADNEDLGGQLLESWIIY